MKSSLFSRLSIVALCGLLATPAAFAASGPALTSKLGNLKFGVIDLSPNDGVAASYRLNKESVNIYNRIEHTWRTPEVQTEDLNLAVGDAAFSHLSKGPLHTTIQSNGNAGDVTSEVRRDVGPLRHAFNFFYNKYSYTADLTLSPGAALLLSGNMLQQFTPGGRHKNDDATSDLSIKLAERSSTVFNQTEYSSYLTTYFGRNVNGWNYQDDFSVVLANFSNADITIDLGLQFSSSLYAAYPLSAVPEPGSYAMFGAGLALLGVGARRRQRRR